MTAPKISVGIVGVSGYSGMELARILSNHPHFQLELAISDKWAGRSLGQALGLAGKSEGLRCLSQEEGAKAQRLGAVGLVFLCTPAEVSLQLAPVALAAGARVIDLSGGFRLSAGQYPRWYGFEHAHPDLLSEARYSLPEVTGGGGSLRTVRLVANPGCYATASALALLPLLQAGVIDREGIIVDAKSGTTGAGRRATEELSFSEMEGDFRAYRVLKHQHTPEIEKTLALAGLGEAPLTFTAHLLPVRRGILVTAYGRLRPGKSATDAVAAVEQFASGRPFLRALNPDLVRLQAVVGTNRALLGADADPERKVAIGFCAIDNLVKGAAGQAVQNANLMLGFEETAGLAGLSGSAP
jgi:N-acetyl-gamma-glutamyl-phosphate reductase